MTNLLTTSTIKIISPVSLDGRDLTLSEHLLVAQSLSRYYGRNLGKKYLEKHVEIVV